MKKRGSKTGMDRRQALRRLVAGAGASAVLPVLGRSTNGHGADNASTPHGGMPAPQELALGSAEPADPSLSAKDWKPRFFDEHENKTVSALADLIIPDTDTPGAKAAQVNRFIDLLLSAETPEKQKDYLQALGWLDGHCLELYSRPFVQLDPTQQRDVLTLLTHENEDPRIVHGVRLFRVVKRSIVEAYYNSEIGLLQELKYETNPFQTEFPGCKKPDVH